MDKTFINSENSKHFDLFKLKINLNDKIRLGEKNVALSNVSVYYTGKKWKSYIKTLSFKCQDQDGMTNLNYLMNHIMYHIFKCFSNILEKTWKIFW